ncbi:MAG: hypothetical protein IPK12_19170 [Gemmatimonadetes bacterium]|nr:hypothetical protein [Gemmatimonadota bacterium]
MSPRTLKLVLVFLTGFVLLAYAPVLVQAAPTVVATLGGIPTPSLPAVAMTTDLLGDILLGTAAALLAVLLVLRLRHRVATQPAVTPRPALHLVTTHESPLRTDIRKAAATGERVPALARRFRLSQDAVRVALHKEGPADAARPERSSRRERQLPPPAKTPVRRPSRTGYQARG